METILTGLAKDITMSLGHLLYDEISKVLGVKKEINKLSKKLNNIIAVIADAEQTVAQNAITKDWLKQLKEVMYEAENIIDYFKIEAEKRKTLQTQDCCASSVFNCCKGVAEDRKIANDIIDLNQKMDKISMEKSMLHLNPVRAEDQTVRSIRDVAPHLEPDIVGVDVENDSRNLINLLSAEQQKSCLLVAVLGTVGVGKTTLARKIYHSESTRNNFPTRLWMHVSKEKQLMIWSDGSFRREENAAQLEWLGARLEGNKFLLVVDDVWRESIWDDMLEAHALRGAHGSRVLVTTRHEHVAKRIGVDHLHRVKRLNEDDGWWLLHTRASLREYNERMQDIGRSIVRKCNGLPMAIRRIGCVLRGLEPREDDWMRVYSSDFCGISEEIQHAVNLSYLDMSYYLKRCFLYCSLFPEEFVIERRYITQQWIAEGFIKAQRNATLEEVAEGYYKELMGRSLLQPEPGPCACGITGARMPHLFGSFAHGLLQDENFSDNPQDISDLIIPRRLLIAKAGVEAISDQIGRLKSLRTLLLLRSPLNDSGLEDICRKLVHLRVLDLGATQIENVSRSIERLVHLRYLNLSETRIRELPESIESLKMLQFLVLKNCPRLSFLPRCVGKLRKLRSLDISGTELNYVPFSFTMMEELNSLHGFLLKSTADQNDHCGWPFQELSTLSKLTSLQILRLDRALNREEASEAVLHGKQSLKQLELCCGADDRPMDIPEDAERMKEIFEELRPPKHLVSLKLVNYYGHEYPSWVSVSNLEHLQQLELDGCLRCRHLPPLGQMTQLKFLAISGSDVLSAIGPELRGTQGQGVAFPKLEKFLLSKMSNLESWLGLVDGDMPSLQKFRLDNCPKLNSLPAWIKHCMALTSLQIEHADSLDAVQNLPALKELVVHENPKLERISNLPLLEDLKVTHCPHLHVVDGVTSLCYVHIEDKHRSKLPAWLQQNQAPVLKRLEIVGTVELLERCSDGNPDWPAIQRIDHVYAKLPDGCSYFSYTKSIGSFRRSQESAVRASLLSSPSFSMHVVPETNSAAVTSQIDKAKMQISKTMSLQRIKNQLFPILLYVTQYLIFWLFGSPDGPQSD